MDDLLERLKRERRWAVAIFLGATGVIGAIRFGLAPDVPSSVSRPVAVEAEP